MFFKEKENYYTQPLIVSTSHGVGINNPNPAWIMGNSNCSGMKGVAGSSSTGRSSASNAGSWVVDSTSAVKCNVVSSTDSFELGTDWGDEKSHHVREVQFNRADLHHPDKIVTIYYDSKHGLEKRGIQVGRPSKKKKMVEPNPFPGYSDVGCTPPNNWRGRRVRR